MAPSRLHLKTCRKLSHSRRLLRPLTPLTTGESDAGANMNMPAEGGRFRLISGLVRYLAPITYRI